MNICGQEMPWLFRQIADLGCLEADDLRYTTDGFCAVTKSVADILACRGVTTFPDEYGTALDCRLFYDDWYLYSVLDGGKDTYGLYKMREQEFDERLGLTADGDAPGVTISFVALRSELFVDCLSDPDEHRMRCLSCEINRVVASLRQTHSKALKKYFMRVSAQGAYVTAKLFTEFIASASKCGFVAVPERYAADRREQGMRGRLPDFIEENNKSAGVTVCDHEKIFIRDACCLAKYEQLAILATHTGNVSFCSFAAEVQFHALFLMKWLKIIPFFGRKVYNSAIRADMSIADAEFAGVTPYYRDGSWLVKKHRGYHGDEITPDQPG